MLRTLSLCGALFIAAGANAADLISLFPIEDYDQNVADFVDASAPDYNQPLLSPAQQNQRMQEFYSHYFSSSGEDRSPWNETYVDLFYNAAPPYDLKSTELSIIAWLSNKGKSASAIGYGENFRPHTDAWIDAIQSNMNLDQFSGSTYSAARRGITVINLSGRALPTNDPHFYSYKLPGQGYPFDNDQETAVWAGTPVYVAGVSLDGKWDLVISPDVLTWVHSDGVAYTDENFVTTWQNAAARQLAAITATATPIVDQKNHFHFSAYVGSVFPVRMSSNGKTNIMIPSMDKHHMAVVDSAVLPASAFARMPLTPSAHQFANLIETLQGRPYGWGNYNFYNDCSAETKSLMTPFGIYLARHSSAQINSGKVVDESAASRDQRISYLLQNGHKFMTIVYIGGHVFLYIGNTQNYSSDGSPMIYQSIWGLSPADYSRRAVIGETILFPLLAQYPEDPSLVSLASKKYFQVSYLDQQPAQQYHKGLSEMQLRAFMLPEGMLEHDLDR